MKNKFYNFRPEINKNIRNTNQIVKFGNSVELMKKVKDESVSLVVTSPPYNLGKDYGIYNDKVPLDKWKHLIADSTEQIFRILKKNGSFFLNVSQIPGKNKEIVLLPYICYEITKDKGFYLRNMIVWQFNNMVNCVNRLSGRYENILWCVKDINNYIFNLDDVRLPYITKKDKRLDQSKGRNPTDVWYFDRVNNVTKKKYGLDHPCVYPLPMIERIIKMSSKKGDWILDPFIGSGTTLIAAANLNRNGIGFEMDKNYSKLIKKRLDKEVNLQEEFSLTK